MSRQWVIGSREVLPDSILNLDRAIRATRALPFTTSTSLGPSGAGTRVLARNETILHGRPKQIAAGPEDQIDEQQDEQNLEHGAEAKTGSRRVPD